MEFEIGDKVIIKNNLVSHKLYDGLPFLEKMEQYKGKIAKITNIIPGIPKYYRINIDENSCRWNDKMLERYTPEGLYVFEGTEGCGKSTIIQLVKNNLETQGYKVITIREPGGINICEDIRNIIFSKSSHLDKTTELLLMLSMRNENYHKFIKEYTSQGYIVLCDRYMDSTLVYQGMIYGESETKKVRECIENVFGFYFPPELRYSFYLQLNDVKTGLDRIHNAGRQTNKFDEMPIEFHQNVKRNYDRLYENEENYRKIINADRLVEDIAQEIVDIILGEESIEQDIKLYKPNWIPCYKSLPKDCSDYLVTLQNGTVMIAVYFLSRKKFMHFNNKFEEFSEFRDDNPVIAWMELPTPYDEDV